MIRSLDTLSKLSETLLNPKQSQSANLPVGVEVVQKLARAEQAKAAQYLLKLEGKLLEALSEQELNVGQKYWAQVEKSPNGALKISNLTQKPQELQQEAHFAQTAAVAL